MVRRAEVGLRFQDLVGPRMLDVLSAVVVGDGLAKTFRHLREPHGERLAHLTGRVGFHLRELRVSGLAFDAHLDTSLALSGHGRVRLPVSGHSSLLDCLGSLGDRDSARNTVSSVTPLVYEHLPFLVRPDEVRDEFRFVGVDPLIDSFVTHGELRMEIAPASGDELGRPAGSETFTDVPTDAGFLQAISSVTLTVSVHGSLMRFVRKVVPGLDGRRVAPQLARERSWIPA